MSKKLTQFSEQNLLGTLFCADFKSQLLDAAGYVYMHIPLFCYSEMNIFVYQRYQFEYGHTIGTYSSSFQVRSKMLQKKDANGDFSFDIDGTTFTGLLYRKCNSMNAKFDGKLTFDIFLHTIDDLTGETGSKYELDHIFN